MSAEEHPQTNPLIPKQSRTPYHISGKPEKQDLVDEYKGKNLDALRTPALIIDRAVFARNCAKMHEHAKALGARFRAHVKSHKVRTTSRICPRACNSQASRHQKAPGCSCSRMPTRRTRSSYRPSWKSARSSAQA